MDARPILQKQVERAEVLVREGHAGRAAKELTRSGPCPVNADLVRELKSLHPTGPKVLPVAPDAPPLQRVDTDELAKIIGKMANGAAPGRSGWTGDLLRALIHDDECLQGLGYVIADVINGIHKGEA